MNWTSFVNIVSGESGLQVVLTVLCLFLLSKLVKYCFDEARKISTAMHPEFRGRRLGNIEEIFNILSTEKRGGMNICVAISLRSKQSLVYQHVQDALILLAKRQPMLRAVITKMENGDKYFEIKNNDTVAKMLDITASDTNASDWQDVWFDYTSKLSEYGLVWRVVILKEEFVEDTQDFANTLMFVFAHASIDGISCVKFCKQFLDNMNEIAKGGVHVDQTISSLDLLPYQHDIVTRGRYWHLLFNFLLTCCGLRLIASYVLQLLLSIEIQRKPCNPYYVQYPPRNVEISNIEDKCRLSVNIFDESETKNIVQACRANKCTVTGAIAAAAHLAFCQLLDRDKAKDAKLEQVFPIGGRQFCEPKPHETYLGVFMYASRGFYMKYESSKDVDFWNLARETSERIQDAVKKQAFVTEETVLFASIEPKKLVNMLGDEKLKLASSCNSISSLGSFDFGDEKHHGTETYKLQDCSISTLVHGIKGTFFHVNHAINGRMTWHIATNDTVNSSHAKIFANLCFDRFTNLSCGKP